MSSLIKKVSVLIKNPELFYVIICAILVSGIINFYLEGIPTVLYTKSLRSQSLVETAIYITITILGLSGGFLLIKMGDQRSKRIATLYFTIGLTLLLIASILPYWIWWLKFY